MKSIFARRGATKTVWVTGDGGGILVADMESEHIANTILYLKEHAFRLKVQELKGETNKSKINAVIQMPDEKFLSQVVPTWNALCQEAVKRRLNVSR